MAHEFRTEFVKDYVAPYGQEVAHGKIALEEHYESPTWDATGDPANETARNKEDYFEAVKARLHSPEIRIEEMDRNGVEMFIMSLTQPGIQEVLDTDEAVQRAHEMNVWIYENYVQKYPTRFNAFAAVALQDPEAAAKELEFCVKELGFVGALVNGYTMKNDKNNIEYLDEKQNFPFWQKLVELSVPLYLHPREPAPNQQPAVQRPVRRAARGQADPRPPRRRPALRPAARSASPEQPEAVRRAQEAPDRVLRAERVRHHERPLQHASVFEHAHGVQHLARDVLVRHSVRES